MYAQDEAVKNLLVKQEQNEFLQYCTLQDIPLDIDSYIFSFNPNEVDLGIELIKEIGQRTIIHPKLMINASTLGLHGTEQLKQYLPQDEWVYLPDIIQEGNALASFIQTEQLIVGCERNTAQVLLKELLRPLFPREQQYLFMPMLDAEFTKLSISGMLATRISYINDLAVVAEKLGIDIEYVRQGMAADSRIGSSYLYPGAGFGGENFSHDILTLANTVSGTGAKSQLLAQVWDINEQQKNCYLESFGIITMAIYKVKQSLFGVPPLKKIPRVFSNLLYISCLRHFGRKVSPYDYMIHRRWLKLKKYTVIVMIWFTAPINMKRLKVLMRCAC